MSHQIPTSKALRDPKLVLNNNYHAVHHDLPHVPWFALREVYELVAGGIHPTVHTKQLQQQTIAHQKNTL
jgi:fatty acid desaturase